MKFRVVKTDIAGPDEEVEISDSDMEYLHNALQAYMIDQAGLAQVEHKIDDTDPLGQAVDAYLHTRGVDPKTFADGVSGMFVAQYVDVKTLRSKLVTLVGYDLTEEGL